MNFNGIIQAALEYRDTSDDSLDAELEACIPTRAIPMGYTPESMRAEINCRCRCHKICDHESSSSDESQTNLSENYVLEWSWDRAMKSECTELSPSGNEVIFHKHFSNGTAAIRGEHAFTDDQHFWEIKMTTSVYGTDMMVGCGTSNVDLKKYATKFVSLLGLDSESWGLSYSGVLTHNGVKRSICDSFGQGMTIGMHLDMWLGRLSLFRNGKFIGVGFSSGLRGKEIYPMACSTAARTGMKITRSCSFPTSLQFMCCQVLRSCIPGEKDVTKAVNLAPGLRLFLINNLDWLLRPYTPEEVNEAICRLRKRAKCVHEMLQDGKEYPCTSRKRGIGESHQQVSRGLRKRLRPEVHYHRSDDTTERPAHDT